MKTRLGRATRQRWPGERLTDSSVGTPFRLTESARGVLTPEEEWEEV